MKAVVVLLSGIVIGVLSFVIMVMFSAKEPEEMWMERHMPVYWSSLAEAGVATDEYERCLRWAFGEDILSVDLRLWQDRWNERHSDIFIMQGSDECRESLIAVGKAYCNRPLAITIEGGCNFTITDCNFVEIEE